MKKNQFQWVWVLVGIGWFLRLGAQPNFAPPSGVWCSCPPTTGVGSGSVMPTVAAKSYVNGILVRVGWKDLETADNTYNWSLIDGQITAAQSYGKKISLAIGGGPNSPSWLYTQGAQSISYTVPFSGMIPVPWDTIFLNRWRDVIADLGNRYAQDTTIQMVYMTTASGNGFEMQLPFNPSPSYNTIGYTDQKVIDAWEQVVDAYAAAFPNHYLTNDFHPVNSSNAVADSVYAYAQAEIGARYGANGWWWTQNNTTVYPAQYAILQHSGTNNVFTGIQMAYSGVNSASSFGPGGMPAALNLAISDHICYWELWNTDITNGMFDSLLSAAACAPVVGISAAPVEAEPMVISPNPASYRLQIKLSLADLVEVAVFDANGRKVWDRKGLQGRESVIDVSGLPEGMYVLRALDAEQRVHARRLAIQH